MSDFTLVDPRGWEYDLQSVGDRSLNNRNPTSSSLGHRSIQPTCRISSYTTFYGAPLVTTTHRVLELRCRYEKTWGHLFETFDLFLACSWPVIIVTDTWTSKAHIVTKLSHIQSFIKMIRTRWVPEYIPMQNRLVDIISRFGETLPLLDNFLKIAPYETSTRPLRTISDTLTYRKAHSTLSGAALVSLKARIRAGESKFIQQLWNSREKTFLAIDFEWSERNTSSCLEWGYAAVRCNHLDMSAFLGLLPHVTVWLISFLQTASAFGPRIHMTTTGGLTRNCEDFPMPLSGSCRRGHYVVQEYTNIQNKHCPTFPWEVRNLLYPEAGELLMLFSSTQ